MLFDFGAVINKTLKIKDKINCNNRSKNYSEMLF